MLGECLVDCSFSRQGERRGREKGEKTQERQRGEGNRREKQREE